MKHGEVATVETMSRLTFRLRDRLRILFGRGLTVVVAAKVRDRRGALVVEETRTVSSCE